MARPTVPLPPLAPARNNEDGVGLVSSDETLRLRGCRFVVDAVHPSCGAVFLFYCAPNECALHPFYVALCDERSRNKKTPVMKKALEVVKRIDEIVVQKKVVRDERCTFLGSAPTSRSTSCSTVEEDAAPLDLPWLEVLLALCDEATGETVGDEVHSFTQECQRLMHDAEEVRRLYQWTVCSSGILPLHLSLRQLELTSRKLPQEGDITYSAYTYDDDEAFIAYCDPLLLPRPAAEAHDRSGAAPPVESEAEGDHAPTSPARNMATVAADVLSPMTPTSSTSAAPDNDLFFWAHHDRSQRASALTGRVIRTPPSFTTFAMSHGTPTQPTRRSSKAYRGKWDCAYL